MDLSQAMHAYLQQLNLQSAAAAANPAPNLLATNPIAAPMPSISSDPNLNSLALALLYGGNPTAVPQTAPPQIPPTAVTLPMNFQPQQQQQQIPTVAPPQLFNAASVQELQNQIEQQAILNQISQLLALAAQNQQTPAAQIPNIYAPPQPQPTTTVFQQQQQPQGSAAASMMSKPPVLTPSRPIPIPMSHAVPKKSHPSSSLGSGTPENLRKRRHKDVEMLSQPPSQSGSPINDALKLSRSRAFTSPETMKPAPPALKEDPRSNASPDKIAKVDLSECPQRHHPDNMSRPNASLLEEMTTAFILNALGEGAYRASDPNENKESLEKLKAEQHVIKIPMAEIHRMIDDCFDDL